MKPRKKIAIVVDGDNEKETFLFWKGKSPEERISAVEFLREQYYIINGCKTTPRIVRDLRMVKPLV